MIGKTCCTYIPTKNDTHQTEVEKSLYSGVAERCGPDPDRVCIVPAVCVMCHPMCKSCYNACNKCFCCDRCIECCPVPAVLTTIRSER